MQLNHMTLIVAGLQRSMRFYRALGLQPIVFAPPNCARFTLPSEDGALSIEVSAGRFRAALAPPPHDRVESPGKAGPSQEARAARACSCTSSSLQPTRSMRARRN